MAERLYVREDVEQALADHIGPCYEASGLTRRYQCTPEELDAMEEQGVILAVPTDEDSVLYPAFQFLDQVHPHPDMPRFITFMRELLRKRAPEGDSRLDIALLLKAVANPYASHEPSEDASLTIELIHAGRVDDAIAYWTKYFEVLDGPSGWY